MYPVIKELVLADFRERTRRYSFMLTLLGVLFFGYLVATDQYTIRLSNYRGIFNSAWIGALMTLTGTITLSIAGFYLVKNSISRDRITGVGQILAATPVTRLQYLTAKFLSNFLVLALMMAILEVAALVMYFAQGTGYGLNPGDMLFPFLFLSLPAMAFVAAMAVLFESVPFLSGSIGNILYLFFIEGLIIFSITEVAAVDFAGIQFFLESARRAALTTYPGVELGVLVGFVAFDENLSKTIMTFPWYGFEWTRNILLERLVWTGAGLLGMLAAVPFFDRFDRTRMVRPQKTKLKKQMVASESTGGLVAPGYKDIITPDRSFNFLSLLKVELKLMLKGYHWSWYLVLSGAIITQVTVPYETARVFSVAGAMILPIACWSAMGTRERRFNTGQLLSSSPFPVSRQYPVNWLAGFTVALLALSGMIVRAAATGHGSHAAALLIAALFVPSLALTLGSLTGSKKLFEVIYLLLWYVGGVERLSQINFLATDPEPVETGMPLVYLILAVILFSAGFVVRRRCLSD
ncbi:MAG: hypothetical protein ACOYVF_03345 [Candidatus Zixiibacteriota bacterium]